MSNYNKLRVLVSLRYLAESLFFPFISLYLSSIGIETHQIGILIALIPITALICAPIYSYICNTPKKAKIALTIMCFIEPCFVLVLLFSNSFVLCLVSIIFIAIFSSSNYGLIDSLMALSSKEENRNFSSIRVFGSASYLLGILLSSFIIRFTGYDVLFYIAIGLFIATGIMYLLFKAPAINNENKDGGSFIKILTNKRFIGYLIFYILLIGSMQVGDDFFSLYLKEKGSPDYVYSYVMIGFILIEIFIMITYKYWFKKIGFNAFYISIGLLVIRYIIQALPMANVSVLIISQCLRGIIWGIALSLNAIYIIKLLGDASSTRGIVISTFGVSAFAAIFKFSGGYIIEAIGYPYFYLILLGISIIALVYGIFYFNIFRRKEDINLNESN